MPIISYHGFKREKCPHRHTKQPGGYMEWHSWAENKSKTHHQIKCPVCGLYSIWIKNNEVINSITTIKEK